MNFRPRSEDIMSHDSHVNYVLMCSLNRILVLIIKTLLLICPFCVQDWNQLPEDMGEDMDDSGGCAWSSRDFLVVWGKALIPHYHNTSTSTCPALATVLAHAPKHALYLHKYLVSMHLCIFLHSICNLHTYTLIHSFCFNRALAFLEAALKTKCEIWSLM